MFKRITIIGVGLIGGSIGLACKKRALSDEVFGVCRRKSSLKKALSSGAIDGGGLDIEKGLEGAGLVIIASPVKGILPIVKKVMRNAEKGSIVTDVGSAKALIVKEVEKIKNVRANFVGSHPMAGSEKSGVENAEINMFEKAPVIITRTKNTDKRSISVLRKFWERLGAEVSIVSPDRHDALVALSSYLPHAVSAAVSLSQNPGSVILAAGSLRDTTRVSASDPELWKDIFIQARNSALESIRLFSGNLKALERAIRKKDERAISAILKRAKRISERIRR